MQLIELDLYPQPVPPGETVYGNLDWISWQSIPSGTLQLRVFALGVEVPDTRVDFNICEAGVACPTQVRAGALILFLETEPSLLAQPAGHLLSEHCG